ncbi:hypothetical protein GA0074692_1325 [Micromonospora pallida]|uniref:Integral membrane protein n=2 Tax=Micromonospora pallida TaxID=145854 RepID=A0A1C6RXZ0_9ACTN|nr:hypothetical protein GA0074692_1325 [Micromonospora pallida]
MWAAPAEYGQPAATDAKNGVAAPLLAGFSIALLASVGQAPSSFRWPGAVILVLLLVVAAFVLSIQLGFRSRARLYSRADALAWGPVNDLPAEQDEEIRARIQRAHLASWFRAQRWVQLAYNTAIGLLGLALTLVAAPPTSYGGGAAVAGSEAAWRWTAFGVGLLLTGLEVGWILRDEYRRLRARRTPTGASGGEGSAT